MSTVGLDQLPGEVEGAWAVAVGGVGMGGKGPGLAGKLGLRSEEILPGHGVAGLEGEGLLIVEDGLIEIADFKADAAEVVDGVEVIGPDLDGLFEMGAALGKAFFFDQGHAVIVFGEGIGRGAGEGSLPEGDAVVPVAGLDNGGGAERGDDGSGSGGKGESMTDPDRVPRGEPPTEGDGKADLRQVGVTVSMGLAAQLEKSNDGREHDEVPEPTDEEVGAGAFAEEGKQGQGGEEAEGEDNSKGGELMGKGVIGREVCGPKELAQIDGAGKRSITEAVLQGDAFE